MVSTQQILLVVKCGPWTGRKKGRKALKTDEISQDIMQGSKKK